MNQDENVNQQLPGSEPQASGANPPEPNSFSPESTSSGSAFGENPDQSPDYFGETSTDNITANPFASSDASGENFWQAGGSEQPSTQGQPPMGYDPNQPFAQNQTPEGYDPNQPFGQTQPPMGYDPNQAYNAQGYGMPAPKKKRKGLLIGLIAGGTALVAGLLVFFFWSSILKMVAPEKYLAASLARTSANIASRDQRFPDFARFAGKPAAQEFDIKLQSLDFLDNDPSSFYYQSYRMLEGSKASGAFMLDPQQKKLLLELSVSAAGYKVDNNEFYISPELVALSIPTFYKGADYITINPSTFREDWNGSIFGENSKVPAEFDLKEIVNSMFGAIDGPKGNLDSNTIKYGQGLTALWNEFVKSGEFTSGGASSKRIGGKTQQLDQMGYTFSGEAQKALYQGFLGIYRAYMLDTAASYDGMISAFSYNSFSEEEIDQMIDQLFKVEFLEDMTVTFYINQQGLVSRMEIPSLMMSYLDSYSSKYNDARFGFVLDLAGETCVADVMEATLDIKTDYAKASVIFSRDSGIEKGAAYDLMDLDFRTDGKRDMKLYYEAKWDKNQTDGENFNLAVGAEDKYSDYAVGLSGQLTDEKDKIILADGELVLLTDNEQYMSFRGGYTLRTADSSEIAVDTADSISLFEFDYEELGSILDSL